MESSESPDEDDRGVGGGDSSSSEESGSSENSESPKSSDGGVGGRLRLPLLPRLPLLSFFPAIGVFSCRFDELLGPSYAVILAPLLLFLDALVAACARPSSVAPPELAATRARSFPHHGLV